MNTTQKTNSLTVMAMLSAMAFVSVAVIHIPLIPMLPFLTYDPKDIIILIGGFLFGPLPAALSSIIVALVELFTISSTGIIGFIMNVLSTVAFVCPAAYIYKKKHSVMGAVIGMAAGTLLMTFVMVLWNYLITPIYMGYPREAVVSLLLPAFIPFNLLKGVINSALTLIIYKPLVTALRKSRLWNSAAKSTENSSRKLNLGMTLTAALILISCIMVILVIQGVI